MNSVKNRLSDLIISNCKDPHKTALLLHSGQSLTYGQLIQTKAATEKALQQFHVQPWERIALVTNNSLVFLPVMLAVMENAVCVPLDPEMTAEQYQDDYQLLGIDWLLCDEEIGPAVDVARAGGIGAIAMHVPDADSPNHLGFDLVQKPRRPSAQKPSNNETALVFTTSGTTSQPKVVPMLYPALANGLEIEAQFYDYDENSIQLLVVKLFRNPAIQVALKVLIKNGQIIYTDGMNPKRMCDCLLQHPITNLNFQPAGMLALLKYCQTNSIRFTHQRRLIIVLTGAPLPLHLKDEIENLFRAQLIDQYGMTEVMIITSTYKTPRGYKAGSVGCPIFKEITLRDNEVLVKNFGLFPGYENNPEANQASFYGDWFRTGDVGMIDADGYLFIQGRVKELINRGGEKISPYELEEAIMKLGNAKEAVVFPYPNKHGSDDIGVVLVPKSHPSISLREIRAVLNTKINAYKLPRLLYLVNEIPVSSAHKIQRNLLYQQLQSLDLVPQTLKNPPRDSGISLTPVQSALCDLWKSILEQDYVDLDDNFFDLGGDSLSAAELLAAIETSLGCALPVNRFFQQSTIRDLAQLVEETPKSSPYSHLVPIRPEGHKAPLFLVHDINGDVVTYHHLAEHIDPQRPVYGLNLSFPREKWDASVTLTEIANTYVQEVLLFNSTGPYYVGGLSIGGAIALEMARLLNQQSKRAIAIMLDTVSEAYVDNSLKPSTSVRNLLKYSSKMIRGTSPTDIPQLIIGKLGPAKKVVYNAINAKKYVQYPQNLNKELADPDNAELYKNKLLLRHVYQQYHPAYYPGKVYYFKASKSPETVDYWRALIHDFNLIAKNCNHTDFVEPGHAADTGREFNNILDKYEAAVFD